MHFSREKLVKCVFTFVLTASSAILSEFSWKVCPLAKCVVDATWFYFDILKIRLVLLNCAKCQ